MGTNIFNKAYLRSLPPLASLASRWQSRELPRGPALVLSPHYDDEVIGAGGTISLMRDRGERVRIVYMTDGREGIPCMPDKEEVEKRRREESARALELLGGGESFHLRARETRLSPRRELVGKLASLVREFSPQLILLPWFFDNHVDHVETNRLLRKISHAIDPGVTVLGFEVWTPLLPNLFIDIAPVAGKKREALLSFSSQLAQVDYLRTSMALSRRRALEAGFGGYAEAFLRLPAAEYLDWVGRSGVGAMRFVG